MPPITALLLIVKARHRAAASAARALTLWLEARHVAVRTLPADAPPDTLREAARQAGAAIILGGDGTLVGAARKLLPTGCPLLGINHGKVGFLAEVPARAWEGPLERLLSGSLPLARRAALAWELERDGEIVDRGNAINDLVVGRGAMARVIAAQVSLNGLSLGQVRADALVVGTPTGSSGYVLSTGASLIHPDMDALTMTLVSPFQCVFPAMVLPLDTDIQVSLGSAEAFLTLDGQDGLALVPGDTVRVRGLGKALPLFVPSPEAYFQRLRASGFVRTEPADKMSRSRRNGASVPHEGGASAEARGGTPSDTACGTPPDTACETPEGELA